MNYEDLLRCAAKEYLEFCGSCNFYHPRGFFGDCRDDSNRFAFPEELVVLWQAAPKLLKALNQIYAESCSTRNDEASLHRCNEIAENAIVLAQERT